MLKLRIDQRTLEPGFAGELAPDELEYVTAELLRDKKLAFRWGFQPARKRRPEWAIRQVAMWGDPEVRATNMGLARRQIPSPVEVKGDYHAQRILQLPLGKGMDGNVD